MQKYYYPEHSVEEIFDILHRGGQSFWDVFQSKEKDREQLQGWVLNKVLRGELERINYLTRVEEIPSGEINSSIERTVSLVKAVYDLCQDHKIEFKVFLIPVGINDPNHLRFWRIWPVHFFNWQVYAHAQHLAMAKELKALNIPTIDLLPTLDGIPDTHHKFDHHWSEKGHDIVSDRVLQEIYVDVAN